MNIRTVKTKIKSVSNVRKITKAMQMVSAVKMKKSQKKAIEGEPYQHELKKIIQNVILKTDISYSVLLQNPPEDVQKTLNIVITSNKGLCGPFNFNLIKFLIKKCNIDVDDFIIVGKKGGEIISRMGGNIIADFTQSNLATDVSAIFNLALTNYFTNKYKSVSQIFNSFISTLKVESIKEQLIPVCLEFKEEVEKDREIKEKEETSEYTIEPSPRKILDPLLKNYVEERIRDAIIQSEAGEHSSRMIAMKDATENANDVVYNLTLLRNKLRQQKITYELLDMITAKESVIEES